MKITTITTDAERIFGTPFRKEGNSLSPKNGAATQHGLTRGAFTLVELLLVLTILAILAGIVLPKFTGVGESAKIKATKTQIAAFRTALNLYEVEQGGFPKGRNGLSDLVFKPSNAKSTWHKYLDTDKLPNDPWDQPYVYECPGRHNPDGYDIYSMGPTGKGGNDAIGNWTTAQ